MVWLTVMALFPLSVLLLKFNRGRLSRESHASLYGVLLTIVLVCVIIGGNIAIDPTIVGYEPVLSSSFGNLRTAVLLLF